MTSAVPILRPLAAEDLETVVEIDRRITGTSRRGFYEKRLAAAIREPKAFFAVAAIEGGAVAGFVFAHLQDGEFGNNAPIAVLDSVGVIPEARGRGVARALMAGLEDTLKARNVTEIQTEAGWAEHDLVEFFAAAGFDLAPRLVLERGTAADF